MLVGGVSRGFNYLPQVGPIYFSRGRGGRIEDVDGNEYIDLVMGWGSLLLGHDASVIREAILEAMETGFLAQYETVRHVELAELICEVVPCAERVRFAASGLEATQYAIRLARAFTGREKVVKIEGHFHGLHDQLQFASGSPLGARDSDGLIEPIPTSAGIPRSFGALTVVVPYNNPDVLARATRRHRGEIAAIILEPIALNGGCIMPDPGYLPAVREIADHEGITLVFDEILTGFRVGAGGAQELLSVTPDLACFSKALGCGLPFAALAGRREVMDHLGPPGDVPMSGTNSARLLSVAGTLASLRFLLEPGFYQRLGDMNDSLVEGLRTVLARHRVPAHVEGIGGRVGVYFGLTDRPRNTADVVRHWNKEFHAKFFRKLLLDQRVYGMVPLPSGPDAINVSAVHTEEDLADVLARVDAALTDLSYSES